jgi:hypothetical protein
MIGCGMVASVRSDKKVQEELENEILYRFIYTTGVSELQLSFRVDAMVVISNGLRQRGSAASREPVCIKDQDLPQAGLACRYDLL